MIHCECGIRHRVVTKRLICECGRITASTESDQVTKNAENGTALVRIGKPGTELRAIVPKFFAKAGCNCTSYARRMDSWGVSGCVERFDNIVDHLVKQADNQSIVRHLGPVNRIVASHWVRTAIDRAREKEASRKKISAVWVYWAGGADGDELRYSVRSVEKHFSEASNFVICGDKPDWFTGDHIPSPRFNRQDAIREFGTGRFAKWVDSVVKLRRICESDLVTEDFLWLYDDTFFVRDVTTAELSTPRVSGLLCADPSKPVKRKWREVLRRTAIALDEAGRPSRNFSHHAPMVYNKTKLMQTIERFDPYQKPRAIESLYGNHHFDESEMISIGDWLQYTKKVPAGWAPKSSATIVNVGGFNGAAADAITRMFPDASGLEVAG